MRRTRRPPCARESRHPFLGALLIPASQVGGKSSTSRRAKSGASGYGCGGFGTLSSPCEEPCQERSMQTRAPYPSALPEAWAQVLDEVDATLRQAEIAAAQRGQAMSQFATSPAAEQERLRA